MEAYTGFAQVYDLFMDNVPYEEWSRYLTKLLARYGVKEGILLELGCGTGKMTRLLTAAGYDMIGVDSSQEMLSLAMEQETPGQRAHEILYLCQDMRTFELYGTVAAAVSVCDSMNYLLTEEDFLEVLRLVNNYLDPGGLFVFDFNTVYKYREILGEQTICENREDASFIWDNYYDEEEQINEYDLTIYVRETEELYRRFEETHFQRGYELNTVKELIGRSGLEFVAAYDGFTKDAPRADSQRICVVAREKGKEGH